MAAMTLAEPTGFSICRVLATKATSRIRWVHWPRIFRIGSSRPALRRDALKAAADAIVGESERCLLMIHYQKMGDYRTFEVY